METDGGGGERGRGNVYYVRDGAKSKMGKRSSDSGRERGTNERLVIKGRGASERANQVAPFSFFFKMSTLKLSETPE